MPVSSCGDHLVTKFLSNGRLLPKRDFLEISEHLVLSFQVAGHHLPIIVLLDPKQKVEASLRLLTLVQIS